VTTASAIIERQDATAGKPMITYRQAGDRAILIEYGEMVFDLTLNFVVLAVDEALRAHPVEGLFETAPGFRSILISYDPLVLAPGALLERMHGIHDALRPVHEMSIPSRVVHLPVAFSDSQTKAAVERYVNTIRKDAPNCEGGYNFDYVMRYNGMASPEELYEAVTETEQWAAFLGFFPGLPFMFPLDPRHAIFVPKYNPTRTWTPEGALGVGGPCWAIYPVESAGGYQLVGRTIPIYDLQRRNAAFDDAGMIMRAGDRIKFHRVEEPELLQLFEDVRADRYRYRIEDGVFEVGTYLDWLPEIQADADERRARRESAAAATPVP
jgi:allophanate hydrolase subunit 1